LEFFRYIIKRLIAGPFIILGLVALVFFISRIIPADPVAFIAGELASPEEVAELKQKWGLDQPLYLQFFVYLKQLAKGDLGISLYTRQPVIEEIVRRLPATLELTIGAVVLSVLLGVPLGILTALWRNSWLDHLLRTVSIGALSIVGFWLGIMLQLIFGYKLGWFPLTGRMGLNPPQNITGFYILDSIFTLNLKALVNSTKYILLPAIAISLESFATILRFTRAGVLNVIQSDYVLYERAMGLPNFIIISKYVLRNAITTPVTQVGLIFAQLLGGAVVIETVFDWPGIGIFLVNSIIMSDYKVILGVSIWIGIIYIVVNLVIDIAHTIIDPRRVEK
jgi:peptide/nickel transport system permease protein